MFINDYSPHLIRILTLRQKVLDLCNERKWDEALQEAYLLAAHAECVVEFVEKAQKQWPSS